MSHYVVTTSAHKDALRGDSMDDCFCTRGVAEMRFESCAEAGHDVVRLVRWTEGEPTEIARHATAHPSHCPTCFRDEQSALPALGLAAVSWLKRKAAAVAPLRLHHSR